MSLPVSIPKINFRTTSAYHQLKSLFDKTKGDHLRDMFANDHKRFDKFSICFEEFLFDYSKNRINAGIIDELIQLAEQVNLKDAIEQMFTGARINETENRAVLHTALRNFSGKSIELDGKDIMPGIIAVRNKMKQFSEHIISGKLKGYAGKQFTDVVNIGIGGSDLGPYMVCEALKFYKIKHLNVHFVSNVDGTQITETLKNLDPETTLFLIASKTFTTQETMANARHARKWFLDNARDEKLVAKHFIALSTAEQEVVKFGISIENMFEFWDWVGGRYSLWSAIGLSVCLAVGYENFEKLLEGAYAADIHFRNTGFGNNIPVLMALIGFWNIEFFGFNAHAIIPYDQYLHRFAAYLQQTDMESNGKSVDRNGNNIDYSTGPVIWGEPGTNGQHAFFQLLHQGTEIIPADFIAAANSLNPVDDQHEILMSNFLAQTEALMNGKTEEEVRIELRAKGMSDEEIKLHSPFRVFDGNRPTNTFLIKMLTPYNLGTLIAFYEHKIFVQGVLWNINSFDQWGVELGKKLAATILPELNSDAEIKTHDVSTNGLMNWIKKMRAD
ncbi:MAG: glucose-6-phosphate isomerase [Chitinophagales bacterium]